MGSNHHGKVVAVATQHGKERLASEILAHQLGVTVFVPDGLDTDRFGTFTSEIPRKGSQLDAAKAKAVAARSIAPADYYLATEGSFDAHPDLFGMPMHREVVYWHDPSGEDQIIVKETPKTNAMKKQVRNEDELLAIASKMDFPRHGLILRKKRPFLRDVLKKDARDVPELISQFNSLVSFFPFVKIYAETDLRAHKNPLRQELIKEAMKELVNRIKNTP